jgi:hypothetical protein
LRNILRVRDLREPQVQRMQHAMGYRRWVRAAAPGFTALWLLCAAGCANLAPVVDATKSFDLSVKAGTAAMGDLYRGMNDSEVGLYYLMIELDPECDLGDKLTLFSPTNESTSLCKKPADPGAESFVIENPAVNPPFSAAGVSRRLQLLGTMSRYSATLAMAASAKSPAEYQAELGGLATDLASLEGSLRAFGEHGTSTPKDKGFVNAVVAPLSALAGVVGRWILEHKQEKAVRHAVDDGRAPFEAIANFLAADLEQIYQPAAGTAAEDREATLSLYYSTHRKRMTLAERATFIERVRQAEAATDAVKTAQPQAIPKGLLDAHAGLVKAVHETDKAQRNVDLESVQASLERLLGDLAIVVDSARKLQSL